MPAYIRHRYCAAAFLVLFTGWEGHIGPHTGYTMWWGRRYSEFSKKHGTPMRWTHKAAEPCLPAGEVWGLTAHTRVYAVPLFLSSSFSFLRVESIYKAAQVKKNQQVKNQTQVNQRTNQNEPTKKNQKTKKQSKKKGMLRGKNQGERVVARDIQEKQRRQCSSRCR